MFANLLSAALALGGGAFYVVVYTLWLKRRTSQNIVIGGAAGAIPPLAGWAAAHGTLGSGPACLFAIVLLWTPPHFWALALLLAPHYETAEVPMLPVVRGRSATRVQVLLYTVALVAATAGAGRSGTFGVVYWRPRSSSAGSSACWPGACGAVQTPARAAVLFHYSLLYLSLLFLAVAVDAVVR